MVVQPGCGRSDLEIACVAFRYAVQPTLSSGKLPAVFAPSEGVQAFEFDPPAVLVDIETHQAIQDPGHAHHQDAEERVRLILSDAAREICRQTLEASVTGAAFDFRTSPSNCDVGYELDAIGILYTSVDATEFDDPGPPIIPNPVCHARCLLDECITNDTGGYDSAPQHPFLHTVRCQCQVEEVGDCSSPNGSDVFPHDGLTVTDDFCVPETEPLIGPADYCRVAVADYFTASIRAVNYYLGVAPFQGYDDSCGSYTPALFDVEVSCRSVNSYGSMSEDAAYAYAQQNDGCEAGCSDLACNELQNDPLLTRPCTLVTSTTDCDPGNCDLGAGCDCDVLPEDCFENGPVAGVCLPVMGGGVDGGTDDGGAPSRLPSAMTLLAGEWRGLDHLMCAELDPDDSYIPGEGAPSPSGAVSPYTLTNGTSFTTGLHLTCPAPTTNDVEISIFDTTLEELCRAIPLCNGSSSLELAIAATEGSTLLASGTLEKSGESITVTDDGAPLSVGTHTVDLCVEHVPSEVEACSAQSIRAAAPLGSGIDASGHFAGELALDFVELASKPGAVQLSLTDNGHARVSLPSGFDFPFYGTTVSTYLYVGANGGINTTNAPIAAANTALPAPTYVDSPDIAVYWDDLDPSSGGGIYAWFDGMRFIVSWEDVPHGRDGSSSTSHGVSVQAHIYESGRLELHYLDTDVGDAAHDDGDSATVGIGNLAGTQAVEIIHDSDTLLTSGVAAIGIASSSDGCLADGIIIPPEVACTARDYYLTVCAPTDEMVTLPLPDVSECASGSVGVEGEVIARGTSESTLVSYSTPVPIDEYGNVEIDQGVFRVRWWPVDAEGDHVGPPFTQLVLARTWVHDDCGGSGQLLLALTEDDDTYVASSPDALALLGRNGEDVLTSAEGDDFIGDGPDAGICEANEGADRLVGEDGDDTLDGGLGADRAWGGSGDDLLVGGSDADELHGQEGHDILQGDAHDDTLWGGRGDDVLEGDDGADTLVPGAGVDAVYGGLGDDTIMILAACELTSGALLSGGGGADQLLLPPGLDLQDVENAGVTVVEIESVVTSTALPTHRAACEPG